MTLFDKAKNALPDILSLLEEYCGHPVKGQDGVRFNACPACGESDGESMKLSATGATGRWRCHKCGANGTTVDVMAYVWDVVPLEAAKRIANSKSIACDFVAQKRGPVTTSEEQETERLRKKKEEGQAECFSLLRDATKGNADDLICLSYLSRDRSIPVGIVRQAQNRGMLGFLPGNPDEATKFLLEVLGKERMVECGLWRSDATKPAMAFRPIVSFLPGASSAEFRLARKPRSDDERKALRYGHTEAPWFWKGQNQERALVVEGVIDLWSAVAMGFDGDVVGVPGCNNWKLAWFMRIHEVRNTKRFGIMFDNDADNPDNPGQTGAANLIKALEGVGFVADNRLLPPNQDVNNLLQQRAA